MKKSAVDTMVDENKMELESDVASMREEEEKSKPGEITVI